MPYVNLLKSLPKPKRDIKARAEAKTPENVAIAKQFDWGYFDGYRSVGYGGYRYDGRYKTVAKDIIEFFKLHTCSHILDIGCAKGFLVYDCQQYGMNAEGLDISKYALENCHKGIIPFSLRYGTAEELPYEDDTFDLVISINTLHNLPRDGVIRALKEMQRVSRKDCYVVVDAYNTPEEKELFESWQLTALTHGTPEFWEELFKEAGYEGHYSWNIMEVD